MSRAVRPWPAGTYLLGTLVTGVATLAGLPLLCVPRLARRWTERHRRRAARLLDVPLTPRPAGSGLAGVRDDLLWLPVHMVLGTVLGMLVVLGAGNAVTAVVATPLWWAFPPPERPRLFYDVPVTGWGTALTLGPLQLGLLAALGVVVLPRGARAHARLCLATLAPSPADQLAARVAVLTRTRADVLDAHGAELRRIERDLHDGTQARLVAIAVRLAVARDELTRTPADRPIEDRELVERLLREAHEGTEEAMTELREVVRSVYPSILADRGLAGALAAVTARCPIPVRLDVDDPGPVPAAVAAVAYFAVAEALTNVAKHSGATAAIVQVRRRGDVLTVLVEDDGTGGADPARGTGLAGVRRRVLALDGVLRLDSPPGGPTVVTLELPCA